MTTDDTANLIVLCRRLMETSNLAGALAGASNPDKAVSYLIHENQAVAIAARCAMAGEPLDAEHLNRLIGILMKRRRAAVGVLVDAIGGRVTRPVSAAEQAVVSRAMAEIESVIADFDAMVAE
jgi:hypothetical protein